MLFFELTLDMPLWWFIVGTAFLYVLAVFVADGNYRRFSIEHLFDDRNSQFDSNLYVDPRLIVRKSFIVKRKIPSYKDCYKSSDDEVPSFSVC